LIWLVNANEKCGKDLKTAKNHKFGLKTSKLATLLASKRSTVGLYRVTITPQNKVHFKNQVT